MSDQAPDTGTPDPTPSDPPAPDAPTPDTGTPDVPTDWQAEAEKYKALSRKHEERAKANAAAAKERDELRQASMSDQEKAVEIAKAQTRAEVLAELGSELVDMAVKSAVADRGIDADALLDGLDRSRFITEAGKADVDGIAAWVDRIAPKSAGVPDLGQGSRGSIATTKDPIELALNDALGTLGR